MNEQEIIKKFEAIEKRLDELEGKNFLSGDLDKNSKKKSVKEFFLEKNPKKSYQKTLVICYYLENYKDLKHFKVKDIEEEYRLAKEKTPNNINYHLIQNIQKGYLMETEGAGDKLKTWTLTNAGERVIDEGFGKNETP
jgi:hypothetical protein